MRIHFPRFTALVLGGACIAASNFALAWQKGFVIEWYEPAFYYGAEEGISAPGTDCPAGTNPEMDWRKVLKTSYRTDADIDTILDPEKPQRAKVGGIRGPNKENVYQIPWAVPDPGLQEVTGDLAYGFNLDADESTGFNHIGIHGETGKKGIDNTYYKAIGCLKAWRGPTREGHHAKYVNDGMHNGRFTLVMLISGEGADWRNDPNVKVGFYQAKDKIVMDAVGKVASDYTFRINPSPGYESIVRARTRDGIVETMDPVDIHMRSIDRLPMHLRSGHLNFEIGEDGKLIGFVGGYRDIDSYFREWAAGGAIFELTMHINIPAYWYALQRWADGHYDPVSGRYTTISTAYRIYANPAIVVSPTATEALVAAALFEGNNEPDALAKAGFGRRRYVPVEPPQEVLPPQIKPRPEKIEQASR
ncbi:hypothetical protein [Aurantivibrio plasticivorans]